MGSMHHRTGVLSLEISRILPEVIGLWEDYSLENTYHMLYNKCRTPSVEVSM